jgi:hypothetical protein
MAKSQQMQIRVTAEEKALIQQHAAEAGMDVSKWVLMQVLPPAAQRFQAFCTALAANPDTRAYVFAELNDFMSSLSGKAFAATVREPPRVQLLPFEANYVAAMITHTAGLKKIPAPRWVRNVEPLDMPWFASSLKSLRFHLLTRSPPAFRSRNLFIDSSIGDRV